MTENEIAAVVVDAALRIHRTLGPGLLESVYQAILNFELQKRGLTVVRELALPVHYEGVKLDLGFRVDLLVGNTSLLRSNRSKQYCLFIRNSY